MQQTTVAANVRAELARRRVRQSEVAERLGVSRQNVAQRLNGSVDFRVGELLAIADLLGIPAANFFVAELPVPAA
jgi:transcriptional regulator with XRE-family HTH domain